MTLITEISFKNKDIIAVNDFSKEELIHILDCADEIKNRECSSLLQGKILANCFYEPSTRTRLSFEAAMKRMGGTVIGFSDSKMTSASKGETLFDSIKVIGHYADALVIRHPAEGSAQVAADATNKPVINAGDGSNQHPTQTLLDLFTIRECQGTLDGLTITIAGDLKYGRTVHSLTQALTYFKPRLHLVAPPQLEMPREICDLLRAKGIKYSYHTNLEEVLPKSDILYMTRIQQERFPFANEYEVVKKSCCLKAEHLERAKPNLKILHPLPRVNEIEKSIDDMPQAYYFQQAENGLAVRQALLGLVLGAIA